jgi:hypothetical protein
MNTTDEIMKLIYEYADGSAYANEARIAIAALVKERDEARSLFVKANNDLVLSTVRCERLTTELDEAVARAEAAEAGMEAFKSTLDQQVQRSADTCHELRVALVANHDLRERLDEAVGLLRRAEQVLDEIGTGYGNPCRVATVNYLAKHDEREGK